MRVLHLLSQRPLLTGSGVTLDAIARRARRAGIDQAAVICAPRGADTAVGDLTDIAPLWFESEALPFPVPGMSDVMPYPSSRFSELSEEQIERYCAALRRHISEVVERFAPDVIHSHHLWLMSSLLGEIAPDAPRVIHSHGTGLRQLELCPQLADRVVDGVRGAHRFAALTANHAEVIAEALEVPRDRVEVVGAGFRDDLFSAGERRGGRGEVAYAGKLSDAKGLPYLLEAIERLDGVTLHVAGGGAGPEAEELAARVDASRAAVAHGRLDQTRLAELLRGVDVFVLPSLYEGLPLVLVEAYASGCRLVATDLPGTWELGAVLGDALERVGRPATDGPDRVRPEAAPAFVADLAAAIERAVDRGPVTPDPAVLAQLSWDAVFERVERIWRGLT